MMKRVLIGTSHVLLALIVAVGLPCLQVQAQQPEHPEHPEKKETPEHPEKPEKAEHPEKHAPAEQHEHPEHPTAAPTIEDVAMFLESHCAEATKASGGLMTIHDEKAGIDRELRLDKIHRERLAKTGEATYFVCADFKDSSGKVFDLDFWVKQGHHGLMVAETMIHKEDGEPRYTWQQDGDVWNRKDID